MYDKKESPDEEQKDNDKKSEVKEVEIEVASMEEDMRHNTTNQLENRPARDIWLRNHTIIRWQSVRSILPRHRGCGNRQQSQYL